MQVYRLEDSKTELPKHWAYSEAWELSQEEYLGINPGEFLDASKDRLWQCDRRFYPQSEQENA